MLEWSGELKDLFDVHLLVTRANLHVDRLESALFAVGAEDKLDWLDLENFLNARMGGMKDADFANWREFAQLHDELIPCGPAQMLETVAERLGPLLAGLREHIPFLRTINAEPADEVAYLVYADWLEERGDLRAHLLRLYIKSAFHEAEGNWLRRMVTNVFYPQEDLSPTRQALIAAMRTAPGPWLYQVFGGADRCRQIRRRIETAEA